jgi:hypothetical protein
MHELVLVSLEGEVVLARELSRQALLHGHGHAATLQHGAVVSDEVKVEVELKAGGLTRSHPLEVGCPCSALRGRERAKRESPSPFSADAIWRLIDEARDGEGGIRSRALHVDRDLRVEGLPSITRRGRDGYMARTLAADRNEGALEARFRMGDADEGKYNEGQQ